MGILRKVIAKSEELFANRSYAGKIAYLKRRGCQLGDNIILNCRVNTFGTEPYLIRLGNQVMIAADVRLITHDGGVHTLRNLGKVSPTADKMAPILIGNNVYLGIGATILPGVKIGDNCIIGAGAIVTKDIPSGSVAVGIPARVVESVEDYCAHTLQKQCLYETRGMTQKEKQRFYETIDLLNRYFQ